MIKRIFFLLLLMMPWFVGAQGYGLRFNRVIDTVFVASITSCNGYTASGQNGTTVTVPASCVWKIESVGPAGVTGNCFYGDCGYSGGCTRTFSSVYFIDGQGERGYLYKNEWSGSNWVATTPSGTVWLSAGTQIIANVGHTSSSTVYSAGASSTSPWYIRLPITIIEFIKVTP
jgi:hypothetical protein